MSNDQRLNAIQKSWNVYQEKMKIVIDNFEKEKMIKEMAENKSNDDDLDNEDEIDSSNKNDSIDDDQIELKNLKQI